MKTTVEPIEDNKIKLTVEVDEAEFDTKIDAAFRRIAREVRVPGFRPGKAPRKILETQLGAGVGREEALRQGIPEYYADAVRTNDIDVIAPPELEITAGEEEGPVAFEAVVETRPIVSVAGYENLRVTIDRPEATDEEIDAQIDRMRAQNATLEAVSRPAIDGDFVRIDITGSQDGEDLDGLTASDYVYEVGAGSVVDELDDELRGAEAGAILAFTADHPDPEQPPVDFRVLVKEVNTQVLPDADDAWAEAESEFDTIEELRANLAERSATVKKFQAQMQLRERATEALGALVSEDIPATMVASEVEARIQDLFQRLSAQGVDINTYLAGNGQSPEEFNAALEAEATEAIRVDLGLRALVVAEEIEADDADLDAEIERIAAQVGEKPVKVRKQLDRNDQLSLVRSDLRRRKALDWLVEHVEIVDADGEVIDRDSIDVTNAFPGAHDHDHDHDEAHDHDDNAGDDAE